MHQTPTKPQNPRRVGVATNARIFLIITGCAGVGTNERMNEYTGLHPVLMYFAPSGLGGLVWNAEKLGTRQTISAFVAKFAGSRAQKAKR